MASGEWRYGQSDQHWTADPAATADEPPDLWGESPEPSRTPDNPQTWPNGTDVADPPAQSWPPPGWARTPTGGWTPPTQPQPQAQPPTQNQPPAYAPLAQSGPGFGRHSVDEEWPSGDLARGYGTPVADPRWSEPPSGEVARPPYGEPPLTRSSGLRPDLTQPALPSGRHAAPEIDRPFARFDGRSAARSFRGRDPFRSRRRPLVEADPADPTYGRILALTGIWYSIPAVLVLIWLVILDSDRRSTVARELLTNLPWFFGAVVLSGLIAILLRWATISWRAVTTSFAAVVIGAGVITILHSFTL